MSNRIAPRFHTFKMYMEGEGERRGGREKVPQQKSVKAALDASEANGAALVYELIVQRTRLRRLGTRGRVTLGRLRDTRGPPRLPRPGRRVLPGRRGRRGSDLGIRFLE